jgi:hypothetical protein
LGHVLETNAAKARQNSKVSRANSFRERCIQTLAVSMHYTYTLIIIYRWRDYLHNKRIVYVVGISSCAFWRDEMRFVLAHTVPRALTFRTNTDVSLQGASFDWEKINADDDCLLQWSMTTKARSWH